jgi:DNA excision repair protein ERCC-2
MDMNTQHYLKTSVRNLVEFVMKEGDLSPGGFQKRDRGQAGTRGHRRIQKSRPEGYEAEVDICHLVEKEGLQLEILGRIDGIFTTEQPVVIEEIKTTTQALGLIDEHHHPLHWAQAQCYAYMYALQHDLTEIRIQLTYYQLDSQAEKTFRRDFTLTQLESFFADLITSYLDWLGKIKAWHDLRDQSIHQFDFPYPAYRPGQRDLAVAVYKTIRNNGKLFAQAPPGVGKTIATLFPAVKAVGMGLVSKIFYLTAKTPGRTVAEKAIEDMRQAGLRFKSVTLTAKEKICFCPEAGCDPEACEFARNYFGKVKTALAEVHQDESFTRTVIIEIARRYEVCPFEFSLDLALWMDCIICDYNYAFDPRVYLRRFFDYSSEPYTFLIDEAHNLPDRARSMYSAELEKQAVLALRRTLKPHLPELANMLSRINQVLLDKRKLCETRDQQVTGDQQVAGNQRVVGDQQALVEQERPDDLLKAIWEFSQKAEDWLALNQQTDFRQELLEFYFLCNTYLRTAEYFDSFYVSYFERRGQAGLKAKLFCLDPAPLLTAALERSQSAIFFSATLLPMDYFEQILTGASTHPKLMLPSPFPPENVSLLIHNRISTKYARRAESYEAIASAIETICAAQQGNYLIFFPSYAYLAAVVELVRERFPEQQLLVQDRGMTEEAREMFLARFSAANEETLIGFAVMGGIFGEGIDLVGERLIGAVIVGVGLPQLGLERNLIRDYFDRQNNSGFAYAYQYPGLNRVLQATGRVIRTEKDRGVIVLIDERFTHSRYRRLFPPQWRGFQVVQNSDEIKAQLSRFWSPR